RAAAQVDNLCYERQIEKLCDVGAGWQPAPAAAPTRASAQVDNLCYSGQVDNLCYSGQVENLCYSGQVENLCYEVPRV
ncbi:MAG: hypothetical protein WCO76_13915, partial [Planctomycetota bacterium]